jgi:hypothetical protein
VKERLIRLKYFIYMYKSRIMESINIFKGEERGQKRVTEEVNLIKVHYMHVWKYHNGTLLYN